MKAAMGVSLLIPGKQAVGYDASHAAAIILAETEDPESDSIAIKKPISRRMWSPDEELQFVFLKGCSCTVCRYPGILRGVPCPVIVQSLMTLITAASGCNLASELLVLG